MYLLVNFFFIVKVFSEYIIAAPNNLGKPPINSQKELLKARNLLRMAKKLWVDDKNTLKFINYSAVAPVTESEPVLHSLSDQPNYVPQHFEAMKSVSPLARQAAVLVRKLAANSPDSATRATQFQNYRFANYNPSQQNRRRLGSERNSKMNLLALFEFEDTMNRPKPVKAPLSYRSSDVKDDTPYLLENSDRSNQRRRGDRRLEYVNEY